MAKQNVSRSATLSSRTRTVDLKTAERLDAVYVLLGELSAQVRRNRDRSTGRLDYEIVVGLNNLYCDWYEGFCERGTRIVTDEDSAALASFLPTFERLIEKARFDGRYPLVAQVTAITTLFRLVCEHILGIGVSQTKPAA